MSRSLRPAVAVVVLMCVGACEDSPADPTDGGALDGFSDASPRSASTCQGDVLSCLRATPGVVSVNEQPARDPALRWFVVELTQPEDHDHPEGKTFEQLLDVLVPLPVDLTAAVVLETTGYEEYQLDTPLDVTSSLGAIQIAMEHRFFASSIAADADWTKLTIEQAAADEHAIVAKLRPLFAGHWINTGRSKGGMTAVFHRRFYPNDVEGTLALVAPISFGAPDDRYTAFIDGIGDEDCRTRVNALLAGAVGADRAAMKAKTLARAVSLGLTFHTFTVDQALEEAVRWAMWTFWQEGMDCATLPDPATVTSADRWAWLLTATDPTYYADGTPADNTDTWPYVWQASTQLGWQGFSPTALAGALTAPMDPVASFLWTEQYPIALPAFNPLVMPDIQAWVKSSAAQHIAFIYGAFDPWSGGAYDPGDDANARDVMRADVPKAAHHFYLWDLAPADLAALNAKLQAWTGVTPHMPPRVVQPRSLRELPGSRVTLGQAPRP